VRLTARVTQVAFPRSRLATLQDLAARVLEHRGRAVEHATLARDLLDGFVEMCTNTGLDGVLVELAATCGIDLAEAPLSAEPRLHAELVARLENKDEFDPGGPNNAKPGQLADCVVAVLALDLTDAPPRTIELSDEVRAEVAAAIDGVVDAELGIPQVRDTIITSARASCEPTYHKAFDRLAAELDERGLRLTRSLKLPIDAVQTVQRLFVEARTTLLERTAHVAIDRAKAAIERANPEAAARIDQPITHKLTPREVTVLRVADPRVPRAQAAVASTLLEGLAELAELTWSPPTLVARPYGISETFEVGELIEHPKFGRGTVKTAGMQRIDVEFDDGVHTLVHARTK